MCGESKYGRKKNTQKTGGVSGQESSGTIKSGERQLGHVLLYEFFLSKQNRRNNFLGKRKHSNENDRSLHGEYELG